MNLKTIKSTTHCCCYACAIFYDINDKSYNCYYDISVYYKDMYEPIYKLYNNADMIINDSEPCIYMSHEVKEY